MQSESQVQALPPQKPTCIQIFSTGTCADSWRAYKQALAQYQAQQLQSYVDRQKNIAASEATAPLQQQVAALNKLVTDQQGQIKKLQDQMRADATTAQQQAQVASIVALEAKNAAYTRGMQQGAGIGVGATLILFALVFSIRRLMRNFTVTKKPQAKAASA